MPPWFFLLMFVLLWGAVLLLWLRDRRRMKREVARLTEKMKLEHGAHEEALLYERLEIQERLGDK